MGIQMKSAMRIVQTIPNARRILSECSAIIHSTYAPLKR